MQIAVLLTEEELRMVLAWGDAYLDRATEDEDEDAALYTKLEEKLQELHAIPKPPH